MVASPVAVNKNTAVYYFHHLRELILTNSERVGLLVGEIEAGESYFGGRCEGSAGAVRREKSQFSVSLSKVAGFSW